MRNGVGWNMVSQGKIFFIALIVLALGFALFLGSIQGNNTSPSAQKAGEALCLQNSVSESACLSTSLGESYASRGIQCAWESKTGYCKLCASLNPNGSCDRFQFPSGMESQESATSIVGFIGLGLLLVASILFGFFAKISLSRTKWSPPAINVLTIAIALAIFIICLAVITVIVTSA